MVDDDDDEADDEDQYYHYEMIMNFTMKTAVPMS